ncbi:MAG TPA: hypothetical protein VIW24_08550 [Aldersonia sp.]
MAITDARAVVDALADPRTLYVFGVIAARTSKVGTSEVSDGTRSTRYVTPFGLIQETSLSRDVVEAAERLRRAGLLEVLVDDERRYDSWRIDEAALAAASTSGV